MQDWEDQQTVEKSETEFQQRILASSYGPHDPKLFWRLFEPDTVPGEELMPGGGQIIQPGSFEEFEAMIEEWDSEGALGALADLANDEGELKQFPEQPTDYPENYQPPDNVLPV